MMWKIKYYNSVQIKKDIKQLKKEPIISKKIKKKLEIFSFDPLSSQFKIKKLKPISKNRYRIKIGNWRVLFSLDFGNKIILIYRIAQRKNIYRKH